MKRVAAGAHFPTPWILSLLYQTIEPPTAWSGVVCNGIKFFTRLQMLKHRKNVSVFSVMRNLSYIPWTEGEKSSSPTRTEYWTSRIKVSTYFRQILIFSDLFWDIQLEYMQRKLWRVMPGPSGGRQTCYAHISAVYKRVWTSGWAGAILLPH